MKADTLGADRVDPERVGLDERRPRSRERVVDDGSGREAAAKQRLGQLRHELAQVRVQAVDVLRPQPLRQVTLRPRELVVDLASSAACVRPDTDDHATGSGGRRDVCA